MLPLDPDADLGRRAWVSCPNCNDAHGCTACDEQRNCADHWRYLLANTGTVLHLQCPGCTHVWDHQTLFGAARRHPRRADTVDPTA
ncbi:hypothetical protein ACIGXM_11360 [Kitasatospora sp. NPDC052896]|uniref:hypothetical protein n=1 Tax=Kitasatospora sp. NPDC052896 TaxID=3364061 RepID=UPI0037C63170